MAGSDYRHRTRMSKKLWADVLVELSTQIEYDNFKNAVAREQGSERARIYSRVWESVYEIQRREGLSDQEFRQEYYGSFEDYEPLGTEVVFEGDVQTGFTRDPLTWGYGEGEDPDIEDDLDL